MLNSVVQNTDSPLEVGVLGQGVDDSEKQELARHFPDVDIRFFDISEKMLEGLSFKFTLSPMTYALVLMADLVDWDQFVYLDVDVVARGDIRELYEIDLKGYPVAAVFHDDVLNAGVLVINGRVWRVEKLAPQILEYSRKYAPGEGDQASIEGVIGERILRLDPRWNAIVDPVWGRPMLSNPGYLEGATVVHFLTGFKPWNLGRLLIPREFVELWDSYRVRARLPRVLRAEVKTLVWQLKIIVSEAFRRT